MSFFCCNFALGNIKHPRMAKRKQETGGALPGIKFDAHNFRKHSAENKKMIHDSLAELGAGRSVVVDKENELIAGNGVYEQAQKLGMPVRIVETDGTELVVVKRTDLATDDAKRKKLAAADNAIADNVEWNAEELRLHLDAPTIEALHIELPPIEPTVNPDEFGEEFSLPEGEKQPFQQMTFILHDEQAAAIKAALAAVKETEEYKHAETFGNNNGNGNALYVLAMLWESVKK